MEALNPRYFALVQLEATLVLLLHAGILWWTQIPVWKYALVYFGFGFSWSAMQYVHHFETPREVLSGARNLRFVGWIDALWLHHNWHLAHHQHPNVPWCYLPSLARQDSQGRDSLLWHYARMWRGPRYSRHRMPVHPKTVSSQRSLEGTSRAEQPG
jgi:fatty acid desaturase